MAQIASIFYGTQTGSIRADMANGRNATISERMTEEEGRICLELISGDIERGKELIICPSPEKIRAAIANGENRWHHATGKKTKGHGGS
jgi:hypothetical protein